MSLVVLPLAYVLLSFPVFPKPVSLHRPVLEVSHIVLFSESQESAAMRAIIDEITMVLGSVGHQVKSFAHFMVKAKVTLV
jgi:hypothetical protein